MHTKTEQYIVSMRSLAPPPAMGRTGYNHRAREDRPARSLHEDAVAAPGGCTHWFRCLRLSVPPSLLPSKSRQPLLSPRCASPRMSQLCMTQSFQGSFISLKVHLLLRLNDVLLPGRASFSAQLPSPGQSSIKSLLCGHGLSAHSGVHRGELGTHSISEYVPFCKNLKLPSEATTPCWSHQQQMVPCVSSSMWWGRCQVVAITAHGGTAPCFNIFTHVTTAIDCGTL